MRGLKLMIILLMVGLCNVAEAQVGSLSGSWKGELKVMAQTLPLIFHFNPADGGWEGSMDSPAQGAKGIQMNKVLFANSKVELGIEQYLISYQGELKNDTIKGVFTQGQMDFPLILIKMVEEELSVKPKPQEPQEPYGYEVMQTSFSNLKSGISLKGTLTKPKGNGPFPAVVLVNGSGQQNRDAEIFGHKPFLVLADYLTQNGIAVLRYDERGVGASEGEFESATSFDFKQDASVAIEHLRKFPFVNQLKIGVIGHSEGGMIAWIMGAEDRGLNFIISLAGPVVPIPDLMMQQTQDVLRSNGASEELVAEQQKINQLIYTVFNETEDFDQLEENLSMALKRYWFNEYGADSVNNDQLQRLEEAYSKLITPWYHTFMRFDPKPYIQRTTIPALALFAENDVQVNGPVNREALEDIIQEEGQENIRLKVYPGLNHLFQQSETGGISEYALLEETFSEEVMQEMVEWINSL
ncbi:alpha/beta fold hydrolase [Echinicola sediminis]